MKEPATGSPSGRDRHWRLRGGWLVGLVACLAGALYWIQRPSPAEREAIATRIRTAEDAMAGRAPVEPFWPLTLPEKR